MLYGGRTLCTSEVSHYHCTEFRGLLVGTLNLVGSLSGDYVFLGRERKVPQEGVRKLQEVGGKSRERSETGPQFITACLYNSSSSRIARLLVKAVRYIGMCFISGDYSRQQALYSYMSFPIPFRSPGSCQVLQVECPVLL